MTGQSGRGEGSHHRHPVVDTGDTIEVVGMSVDELGNLAYLVRCEQRRVEFALSSLKTASEDEVTEMLRRATRHARRLKGATEELIAAIDQVADATLT
jgi:hypothetical protein